VRLAIQSGICIHKRSFYLSPSSAKSVHPGCISYIFCIVDQTSYFSRASAVQLLLEIIVELLKIGN